MLDGFNVHREVVTTRIDVVLKTGFRVFDHQVSVKDGVRTECFSQAANHGRAERQVRDEVAVHHVEVQPREARINGFVAVVGQVCEVGGEDAGCNDHVIPQPRPAIAI